MKKKLSILIILLFVFFGAFAQQQDSVNRVSRFTLEDCINYGLKNNNNRKSTSLSTIASEVAYRQSKMDRLPSVSASATQSVGNSHNATNGGTSWNGNYSVNAGLSLYNGGYLNKLIQKSNLQVNQANLQLEQTDLDLTIQIIQSFLTVLMNNELYSYQQLVVKTSEEQMLQGKDQLEVGKILESDYLLLESQFTTDKYNVENTKIAIESSLNTLENLMSFTSTQQLIIVTPDSSTLNNLQQIPGLQQLITESVSWLPSLKMSENSIQLASNDIEIAKSSYYPGLDLNASIGSNYVNDNGTFGKQIENGLGEQLSLGLNIPIYNKNKTKSQVRQSEIILQQAELDKKQLLLDVVKSLENEYQNVLTAQNKHRASEVKKNAYLASYQVYNEQFQQGSITTVELLQQQTSYLNALNEFLQNKYSFVLNRKILDIYMNVPVKL
ncbi:MAG: TolC family protein [Bacteroidales bacterium]|nr:TolC family protein [Bacteroidales bacterium]